MPVPTPLVGSIYLIRNRSNGRTYVGQTTRSIEQRLKWHLNSSRRKRKGWVHPLHRAIRKFGIENFEIRVLATTTDLSRLNSLERKFALRYRARYPYGYSVNLGSGRRLTARECARVSYQGRVRGTRERIGRQTRQMRIRFHRQAHLGEVR